MSDHNRDLIVEILWFLLPTAGLVIGYAIGLFVQTHHLFGF